MTQAKELDRHEELITCNLIDMPPLDKTVRSFNPEFAKNLAKSLRENGLYNPIAVRPHPTKPGRWLLVQGRHRWHAWYKILKKQTIRATVLPTMDDEEARYAAIAENYFRFEGKKAQRIKCLKVWHDIFARRHNSAGGTAAALSAGIGVEVKSSEGAEPCAPGTPGVEPANELLGPKIPSSTNEAQPTEEPIGVSANLAKTPSVAEPAPKKKGGRPKKDKDFVDHVVASTGVAKRTVEREVRLSKVFSDEELDVFENRGTTQQQIEAIAKIEDPKIHGELVALIGFGMPFEDAWQRVVTGANRSINSTAEDDDPDAAMSNDEWLAWRCSEKLGLLGHPEKFKSDVGLYREINAARYKFRKAVKAAVARRKAGTTGYLWHIVNQLINLSGPMDWFNCPECGGRGEIDGAMCKKCWGAGYLIKIEKYL